jgi:protocatechuate 3,4-dioxygenase beta subunit
MRRLAFALFVVAACVPLRAQSSRARAEASAASKVVAGRVLTEDGNPLRNTRLAAGDGVTLTDGEGRFEITTPEPRLRVTKAGYAPIDAPVTEKSLVIRLPRGAAIAGRALDSQGEPLTGISVTARPAEQRLPETATNRQSARSAVTDDLGEYRIGSLPAGTYTIRASGTTDAVIYLGPSVGGLPEMQAPSQTITLGKEEERSVDLTVTVAQGFVPRIAGIVESRVERGSATLRGRVYARDGRPVPYAQLTLTALDAPRTSAAQPGASSMATKAAVRPARLITVNGQGLFELRDVVASRYRISAFRAGYSFLDPPVEVAVSSDSATDVNVTLDRNGAMTGAVLDEAGDPLEGVLVQALRLGYRNGRRQLLPVGFPRRTDDRGTYRLFDLEPGAYVVTAAIDSMDPTAIPGYARTYFPGADEPSQAQFVTVDASRVVPGSNIALARSRTARIRGQILNAAGQPTTGGRVTLTVSQLAATFSPIPINAAIAGDGRFEFKDVAPGQYVIQVDRGRQNPSAEGEFAALPVALDGSDVSGLVVRTTVGATVRGRITLHAQNSATAPQPAAFEIAAVPADADTAPTQWASAWPRPDRVFEMKGVHGSRRLQVIHPPAGWMVESIRVDGADVTDTPVFFDDGSSDVEVVVTDRAAAIFGSVVDDRGRSSDGAHVLLYSSDRENRYPGSRHLAHAASQADGTFSVAALPAGSYYAVAISRLPDGDDGWQDPQLLESLERLADPVTLREFGTVSVRLRLARP